MADLKTRVDDLTGFGSTDDTALGDWFDDGVKDVMNSIPSYMLPMFSSEVTFTSNKTLGENAKLLAVVRSDGSRDQMCREIPFTMSGRAADNSDVNYATNADPVYYIHNGVLTVLPTAGSCKLQEVSFSDVTITGTSIDNMPNDAEHLVVLYASIRALQRLMNDKSGNADITTALTAINTENDKISAIMDSANTAINKVNAIVTEADTEFDLAKTEIAEADVQVDASVDTALGAITTAAGRINTAVGLANDEFDKAVTATTGPLDLANAEFDKIDALLDLGETDTESAVNTALGAMTTELNKVDDIISTASGKVGDYYTSIGDIDDAAELWDDTNKRFTDVRDAIQKAQNLVDGTTMGGDTETESIQYWLNGEDVEMAQSTVSAAQLELQRAATAMREIENIMSSYRLDIEGVSPYLQTASSYIAQAQGYSGEVSARLAQAQAKREEANSRIASGNAFLGEANARVQIGASYLSEAKSALDEAQAYATEVNSRMAQIDGYNKNVSSRMQLGASYLTKAGMHLQEAQGYGGEASGRMANAQSYASEVTARLNVDTTEYQWLQAQQAQLQKEYERGILELRTPK